MKPPYCQDCRSPLSRFRMRELERFLCGVADYLVAPGKPIEDIDADEVFKAFLELRSKHRAAVRRLREFTGSNGELEDLLDRLGYLVFHPALEPLPESDSLLPKHSSVSSGIWNL